VKEQSRQVLAFYQKLEEKREDFEQVMKKETLEFIQSLLKEKGLILREIKEINQSLIKEREEILKEIKATGNKIIEELQKKVFQTLESFSESIKSKISETQKAIEEYKKEKLEEIDKKIYRMIIDVAKKVLGKAIDISTHEKLVIEALEKAKKENVL